MLTPTQVKLLEDLGFKMVQIGARNRYQKIYSRGSTFLKCTVWLDGFIHANGCVYNQDYEQDLAKLKEGGIE